MQSGASPPLSPPAIVQAFVTSVSEGAATATPGRSSTIATNRGTAILAVIIISPETVVLASHTPPLGHSLTAVCRVVTRRTRKATGQPHQERIFDTKEQGRPRGS